MSPREVNVSDFFQRVYLCRDVPSKFIEVKLKYLEVRQFSKRWRNRTIQIVKAEGQ